MDDQNPKHQDHDLLSDAKHEVKGMASKGRSTTLRRNPC